MAYFTFTFRNTNPDQTFQVLDLKDTSRNPIFNGPVNHNDSSTPIQCWVGSDNKGRVQLNGSVSAALLEDIEYDGFQFDY